MKKSVTQLLLGLAGLDDESPATEGSPHFHEVRSALGLIHNGKSRFYGDFYRNMTGDHPTPVMLVMMLYLETRRKWIRLDNIVKEITSDPVGPHREDLLIKLLETLSDLGVYSALNIEAITRYFDLAHFECDGPLEPALESDDEIPF